MSSDLPLDDTVPPSQVPPLDPDNSSALLAELDVLLERMMALPVNHLDEEDSDPLPGKEQPPADLPLITVAETMPQAIDTASLPPEIASTSDDLYVQTLLHEQPPEPPEPSLPPEPPSRPPEPVAVWHTPAVEEPREEPPSFPTPPVLPPIEPPATAESIAPGLAPALWLKPLVWCDRAFDRATLRLGTLGLWMQHPQGKTILGWAGLLMVAIAGGLALGDCLGWTW